MKQIGSAKGHTLFVRCPTSPPSFEAACDCGFRSLRYHTEEDAEDAGSAHLENAQPIKPKRRKVAPKKARGK